MRRADNIYDLQFRPTVGNMADEQICAYRFYGTPVIQARLYILIHPGAIYGPKQQAFNLLLFGFKIISIPEWERLLMLVV